MAIDKHKNQKPEIFSQYVDAFTITPHDTNELPFVTRGIYVGTAGDVAIRTSKGTILTFKSLAAGTFHPLRIDMVLATGTTATFIVGVV